MPDEPLNFTKEAFMAPANLVFLLVALLAVAGVLVRRRALTGGPPPLVLRLRQPLGKESGVAVVRWGDEELLVGYGSAGVVRLAGAPAPVERS